MVRATLALYIKQAQEDILIASKHVQLANGFVMLLQIVKTHDPRKFRNMSWNNIGSGIWFGLVDTELLLSSLMK
jgi:hypothetical protein